MDIQRDLPAWVAMGSLAGALVCVQATAGPPQDPPTFRADIRAIEVDAIVTDRQGNPVRDLTVDDFEILEDGRPQQVRTFSVVDLPIERPTRPADELPPAVEPDVATNTAGSGRVYVLLLDSPSTASQGGWLSGYMYTMRTKQVAEQFVEEAVQPGDQVAVVHVQGTPTDAQGLTTNRSLMLASIQRFGRGLSGADAISRDGIMGALDTYRAIEDIAKRLGSTRGRRTAIIWIGGQIEMLPERFLSPQSSSPLVSFAPALRAAYRDAIQAATRHNVAIYPVDPSGLTTDLGTPVVLDDGSTTGPDPGALMRTAGLRQFAEDTGGLAVVGTNAFSRGYAAIVRDTSAYYLLGYTSDRDDDDDRFRRIEVRVRRPGVTVRARRGYYPSGADATASRRAEALPPGVSAAAGEALRRPVPAAGLGVDVVAVPFRGSGRDGSVLIGAHVRGHDLALEPGGSLAVSYQLFDIDGRAATGGYTVFSLDLQPATRALVEQTGFRFVERATVRPGRYELRLVADQPDGALGSVMAHVTVPDFRERLAMSGIALAWRGPAQEVALAGNPALREMLSTDPTALRRFPGAGVLLAYGEVYTERPAEADTTAVTAALATVRGDVVARAEAQPLPPEGGGEPGRRGFVAQFDLAALAPGSYVLTVEAQLPQARDRAIQRRIPFAIE